MEKSKEAAVQRNHKDSLFCDLFSVKEYALSLYNAIRGTDYTDPDEISIVTIKDVIFMHQKNDVSILFDHRLTLWEHQSTLNRNMPLRGLLYFAHNIEGIMDEKHKKRLYGRLIVKIPAPEYYVFYNGTEKSPEAIDLKLSEAFEVPSEGHAFLIKEIRKGIERGLSAAQAVEAAIDKSIREGYLVDYLRKIRAEAKTMLLTEFDEKGYEEVIREESYEEGKA